MFNSFRSLESQLSLKSKWKSLKENEKKFIFSREIGHRRKTTTNKNPFVLNEHDVAAKHEAKGRKCSVGK